MLYANLNYREQNEYTQEMLEFLINGIKVNRLVAESFLSKLIWYIRTEEPIQASNDLLEGHGIVFEDMNQANEYFKRFQNLANNTRKWANCGYTPKELFVSR